MRARTPCIWLSAMLLAGCAGMARRDAELSHYLPYAGPPIQRFSYRTLDNGWQVVADYKIVMFVGHDAYLLTVVPPCAQMRLALYMSVSTAIPGSVSRFDRVLLDDQNCLIDQIQQIDYPRMRRDAEQQQQAAHKSS